MAGSKGHLRKIITYSEGQAGQCEEAIKGVGGSVCKKLTIAEAMVCTLPDNERAIAALRNLPCIKGIEDDTPIKAIDNRK